MEKDFQDHTSDTQPENSDTEKQLLDLRNELEEAKRNIQKYKSFCDNVHEGLFLVDTEGIIIESNPAGCRLLGLEFPPQNKKRFQEFVVNDFQEQFASFIHSVGKSGAKQTCEISLITTEGSADTLFLTGSPYGSDNLCILSATDVSLRKQTQSDLVESEFSFRSLADSGQALIRTAGTNRKCNYFNKTWLDFTGRNLEQESGDGWLAGVHPEDIQHILDDYNQAFDRREKFSMEYRLRHKSGEYRWLQEDGTPQFNSRNEFIGYTGHCIDITNSKITEEKLRISDEKYRNIFENIQDTFYEAGVDGEIYEISPSIQKLSKGQYHREELIGKSIIDYYADPEQRSIFYSELVSKGSVTDFELSLLNKDGTVVPIAISSALFLDSSGNPSKIIGSMRDITERKLVEEELMKSEKKYATAFITSPYAIVLSQASDGKIIEINNAFTSIGGYTKEEALSDSSLGFNLWVNLEDRNKVITMLKEGKEVKGLEGQFRKKNGELVTGIFSASIFNIGNITYMLSSINDITESKKAQKKLEDSEFFFKNSQRAASIGSYKNDLETGIWESSEVLDQIFGIDTDFFHDTPGWIDIIHPDDREMISAYWTEEITGKLNPFNKEYRIIRKTDGETRWMLGLGEVIYDKDTNKPWLIGTVQDITNRKNVEEKLRKSEEQYRYLFMNNPHPMWAYSIDTMAFLAVNDAAVEKYGFTREEFLSMTIADIRPAEDISRLKENLARPRPVIEQTSDWRHKLKDGRIIDVEITSHTLQIEGMNAALVVAADITERKRTQSEITKLNNELEKRVAERTAELEAANKDMESFGYSVSHDLRAPLRALDGFANFLLTDYSDVLDDEGQRMLQIIIQNANKMGHLIDDLLSFSRLGRHKVHLSNINMKTMVKAVFADLLHENEKYSLLLQDIPDVTGDPSLIRQLWTNLIDNSIKFSSKRPDPVIEIGSYKDGDKTVYFVKDNGVGFDMNYQNKLFLVFQRLHTTKQFDGTGVGLAIVHRIIQHHKGRIWVDSKVNEGATFFFTL